MKRYIGFIVKAFVLAGVFSQTIMAGTDYGLDSKAIDEPIYLTLYGIGLLYIGLYSKDQQDLS